MRGPTKVQQLMPMMREFGGLERKRLGEGVTPLEFQRWLDLKGPDRPELLKIPAGWAHGYGR